MDCFISSLWKKITVNSRSSKNTYVSKIQSTANAEHLTTSHFIPLNRSFVFALSIACLIWSTKKQYEKVHNNFKVPLMFLTNMLKETINNLKIRNDPSKLVKAI